MSAIETRAFVLGVPMHDVHMTLAVARHIHTPSETLPHYSSQVELFFSWLPHESHLFVLLTGAGTPGLVCDGCLIQRAPAMTLQQMQACHLLSLWLTLYGVGTSSRSPTGDQR